MARFKALLLLTVACLCQSHPTWLWGIKPTLLSCDIGDVFCGPECKTVQLCLADNELVPLATCDSAKGEMCDSATLTCSTEVSVCKSPPDESVFRCHSDGLFPNPYDCHSYFNCNPSSATTTPGSSSSDSPSSTDLTSSDSPSSTDLTSSDPPSSSDPTSSDPTTSGNRDETTTPSYPEQGTFMPCPNNTAYDPLAATCRFTSSARVCREGPIPKCLAPAQSGPQQENPNIYYVCINDPSSNSLVPWLFRCTDPTHVFVNGKCQSIDETDPPPASTSPTTPIVTTPSPTTEQPTSPTPTTEPPTSSTPTTEPPTSPTPSTEPPTSPTPTTEPPTTPTPTTEPPTTPAPTTEPPTTLTPTTEPPTTPTPTTEPTTSPTTTPPTTTPSPSTTPTYCRTPGTMVPDPADCHSYYLCTINMEQIHYTCQKGYYFDSKKGYCVKGSC